MSGRLVSGITVYHATGATGATTTGAGSAQANLLNNAISNSRGGSSSGSAVATAAETMVPLSALATWSSSHTATDRKSTRLNSSHLVISYAVFCLKKKKEKQKRIH